MAYFEELLQDFEKGAKLNLSDWEQGEYIWLGDDNQIYWQNNFALDTMELFHLLGEHYADWEVWQEPAEMTEDLYNKYILYRTKNQSTITKEDFFIELLIANLIGNLVILKSSLATEKSNLTKAYENYVVNLINLYKETNQ